MRRKLEEHTARNSIDAGKISGGKEEHNAVRRRAQANEREATQQLRARVFLAGRTYVVSEYFSNLRCVVLPSWVELCRGVEA